MATDRELLIAQAGKHGALLLTLLMALDDAADFLSAQHENLTNGSWDNKDAQTTYEHILDALKAAEDAKV